MGKKGSLGAKTAAFLFSAVAFITGVLLIDRGSISGNVIVGSDSPVGTVSLIGLLLIAGSFALAAYGMKK